MRSLLVPCLVGLSLVAACNDFSTHQKRYEKVIAEVRARIKPGAQTLRFRTSWDFGPSLAGDTNVCARRTPSGMLFVRITSRDDHHAGRYGYAFADPPLRTNREVSLALERYGCGEWENITQINDNWWRLVSHLD